MIGRFEALRHRLLRGGVAPRQVYRFLRELEDHFADLLAEEGDEAAALARLGLVDILADAMLARPEFHSRTARFPWAVLAAGPVLVQLTLCLLAVLLFIAGYLAVNGAFLRLDLQMTLPPLWIANLTKPAGLFCEFALPLLLGWSIAVAALRQRSNPAWPMTGLVAVTGLGAAIIGLAHAGLMLSVRYPHGGVYTAWSPHTPLSTPLAWFAAAWAANLALTAGPYALLRARLFKSLA